MNFLVSIKRFLHKYRTTPWQLARYEQATFLLNPHNYVDRKICFEGGYEAAQRKAFFNAVRQQNCDILLDIGANFGLYSFTALHHLPQLKEIHAFECDRRNLAHFEANQRLNNGFNKVHLHSVAAGDRKGKVRFTEASLKNSGKSQLNTSGNTTVSQVRLDNYLKPQGTAAVKIDIEGAEITALKGMKNWLQSHVRVIQVEAFPQKAPEVLGLLKHLGFNLVLQTGSDYLLVKVP